MYILAVDLRLLHSFPRLSFWLLACLSSQQEKPWFWQVSSVICIWGWLSIQHSWTLARRVFDYDVHHSSYHPKSIPLPPGFYILPVDHWMLKDYCVGCIWLPMRCCGRVRLRELVLSKTRFNLQSWLCLPNRCRIWSIFPYLVLGCD